MTYDYIVVGSGFFGAVSAQQAAEAGRSVLVIEKRDHIGGNCFSENLEDRLSPQKSRDHDNNPDNGCHDGDGLSKTVQATLERRSLVLNALDQLRDSAQFGAHPCFDD